MELVELRRRLHKQGLVMMESEGFFVVTDNSPGKRGIYHQFSRFQDVEVWVCMLEGGKNLDSE